jgi:hypothetical protein
MGYDLDENEKYTKSRGFFPGGLRLIQSPLLSH